MSKEWIQQQRQIVIEYLSHQGVQTGEVGRVPAWYVDPYIAVWAIESLKESGVVGWWAISGDLPTDYIGGRGLSHPREALAQFATRWKDLATRMAQGIPHPTMQVGDPDMARALAPLLEVRANAIAKFAADDELWDQG